MPPAELTSEVLSELEWLYACMTRGCDTIEDSATVSALLDGAIHNALPSLIAAAREVATLRTEVQRITDRCVEQVIQIDKLTRERDGLRVDVEQLKLHLHHDDVKRLVAAATPFVDLRYYIHGDAALPDVDDLRDALNPFRHKEPQ